jgi:sugar lactone lactonase YvrE
MSSSKSIRKLSCLPAIATLLCASHAFAAAPAVVADAQQTIGTNFWNPQAVAVAPNGTVYVADTDNNQIVKFTPNLPGASNQSKVSTPGYTLNSPQGLAVDAAGDLYIGDTPKLGVTARIIEVVASGGALASTSTVKQLYSGGLLNDPISLAVNSANTLFIGDSVGGAGAIYSILAGGTLQSANITGLPPAFTPSALVTDSTGDLYIANSASTSGGVYVAPAAGGAVKPILTGSFVTRQPAGLALDLSGDLFILAELGGGATGEQVVEIPSASAVTQSTPYIIPSSNLETSGGMALDASGNLDIAEVGTSFSGFLQPGTGLVTQLDFLNPVYLGAVNVFGTGTGIVFNFEFNAPATFLGFRAVTVGDLGTSNDVIEAPSFGQGFGNQNGNCQFGVLTGQTEYQPYTCYQTFEATPQYTGARVSAIQVKGSGSAILKSSPVYELGDAAAQIAYPLDVATTPLGLIQPQGIAISGFDQTVYIADLAGGKVYSVSGLNSVGGLNKSTAKAVSTGAGTATALSAPSAVAMNSEGDLYIADFTNHNVVVVPMTTGIAPFVLNTGGLLEHPISLALDELGDLYIGDAGSDGDSATSGTPGFVVEVPYKGAAFQVPIPGVSVVFPQALAVNSINGDLLIGDGGDISASTGQVVEVPTSGAASVLPIATPTNPSGLTFDAAGNLYILDGSSGSITVFSPKGTSSALSIATSSGLSYPSALASSAGSQSFVVANLGGGTANNLVVLNGNSSTLAFGSQVIDTDSAAQSVTIANIGNQTLTLNNNFNNNTYYSPKTIPGFAISGSDTCAGGDNLTSSSPSCVFSLQFDPTKTGAATETVTINSNAYNSGNPIINLTGTGTPAPVKGNVQAVPQTLHANLVGRKSFAAAQLK